MKIKKLIRIIILCLFLGGVAFAIGNHQVSPENNPLGINYYNDILKAENIPDTVPYNELFDIPVLLIYIDQVIIGVCLQ